jgi:hypothetical protein
MLTDLETSDSKIFELCLLGKIHVGVKLHLVHQALVQCSGEEDD